MAAYEAAPSTSFAVRSMTEDDALAFSAFLSGVPEGERRFLKDSRVDSYEAFHGLLRDPSARRLVAVHGDGIVGFSGAFAGSGWSSHVAELRVIVAAEHRRQGLGQRLARAALLEALERGCTHAFVEVVSEQEALVSMFQDLGFEPEALLADFVRDADGEFHDLMLLTHRADDHWGRSQVLGLAEVVA